MQSKLPLQQVLTLIRPHWGQSRESVLVLLLLLALAAGIPAFSAWSTQFTAALFDAMDRRNAERFWNAAMVSAAIFCAGAVISTFEQWVQQWLEFRWRGGLTRHFVGRWLGADQAFYRLERRQTADNPDQRIADDVRSFTSETLRLGLSLLGAVGTVVFMGQVLWNVSSSITIGAITVPGYMFWLAILAGLFQIALIHWAGHRLAARSMEQQKVEADFRFALVQQREAAEQIAMYRGAEVERARLERLFTLIGMNWAVLMSNYKNLHFTQQVIGFGTGVVPMLALAPKLFSGEVGLGAMMQAQTAYLSTALALGWITNNYKALALWSSVTRRLIGLNRSLDELEQKGIDVHTDDASMVRAQGLKLNLPSGQHLNDVGQLEITQGTRMLVRGPSGVGKSTLLRAIAGLWPHGSGGIYIPQSARMMFVPQKSYIPLGTLKEALTYPAPAGQFDDAECAQVLNDCLLPNLATRLHAATAWSQQLSGGEQQRLAFARVLLARPDIVFLDEATSALDNASEATLYDLIRERLPKTTIVSVAHRTTLDRHHDECLELQLHGGSRTVPLNTSS